MIKDKKGEMPEIAKILTFFIGVVVVLSAFIPTIFNTQSIMTDRQPITDEAVDISVARLGNGSINTTYEFEVAQAPSGWKLTDCPITSFVYGNSTDNYVVTTDYVVNVTDGTFTLVNSSAVFYGGNATLADYNYCADGYNRDSSSRGIARLIGLISVIALLGFCVYYLNLKK